MESALAVPVDAVATFWLFKWWGDVPEGQSAAKNLETGHRLAGAVQVVDDKLVYEWDGEGDVPEAVLSAVKAN